MPENHPEKVYNEAGEVVKGGCVVFDDRGRLLLIKNWKHPRWSLPKGHVEPGEDIEKAALRETQEETGYPVESIRPLGNFRYVGSGNPCRLHVWEAKIAGPQGEAEEPWGWVDPAEVKDLLWPEVLEFLQQNDLI